MADQTPDSADFSRLRVLVVDDNAALRGLLRVTLNAFGVAKVTDVDGVERALSQLRQDPYDLVLTDWKMRPRSGFDLLRELRDPRCTPAPGVKVVMLTAYDDGERIGMARAAGANGFLVKPFTAASLSQTLREVITDERNFIQTETFLGPDRRSRARSADRPMTAAR
ncbi:response regulator [Maricaulis sp.]|uniref:response regulator n=1 Tax=Maricaulis sp. TaxID=1486257 RepID=UPI0026396AD1|nr:response regulator [Maricaulis sp.]